MYEKNLLVYRIDYNEYTGGAHGIYMTTFLNMDLGLMRPLRLDDVFVGEYQEPLTDLIWNQLMADNEAKTRAELEDMGYVRQEKSRRQRISISTKTVLHSIIMYMILLRMQWDRLQYPYRFRCWNIC